MKKLLIVGIAIFLASCASRPPYQLFKASDVDFMFNATEVQSFDYAFGEYPARIIDAVIARSPDLGADVKGVSALAWGFHPVTYIIYTEEKAYISFFFWGNTVGKGYIEGFALEELEAMNKAVYSSETCSPYVNDNTGWMDIHLFKKDEHFVICEENRAFLFGGGIRNFFVDHFGERLTWEKYSYGQ